MGQSIVQIKQMGDALRSSGYKSIDSAVAELIDNSIEAGAHDIFVIMTERIDPKTNRKAIYEFGILDNGSGMDMCKLASCLGIGFTTKSDRRGMGRFGVGLPQASLHVTPSVEVYSWTDDIEVDDPVYKVWLDINKVKTGEQEEIDDPELEEIPQQYRKFLNYKASLFKEYDFTKHGTLVYWKNCDNVKPKTMSSLNDKLEFALGRKFRHLINDGTHNIRLITLGHEETAIDVLPNDPLLLMNPNYVLGNLANPGEISKRVNRNCTEPVFELYTTENNPAGVATLDMPYVDKETGETKTSTITMRFSKVRPEFYDQTAFPTQNPGSSALGAHVKSLEGISIVRANREIDFGTFGFYEKENNPYHRWWGCEICFDPVLDELFGVANNKQQVELHDDRSDRDSDAERSLWDQLAEIVSSTIKTMVLANKDLRKDSRSKKTDEDEASESERIIDNVEEEMGEKDGVAQGERDSVSQEELEDRARQKLVDQGIDNPTIDQIHTILRKEVIITYSNIGRIGPFMDTDFSLGNVAVTINTAHIFYNEFVSKMNEESKTAFELFVGALAQALNLTNTHNNEQNDQLLQEWDIRLKRYLQKIKAN
jgi:hypothetical protein